MPKVRKSRNILDEKTDVLTSPSNGSVQFLFNHFYLYVFSARNENDEFATKYDEWCRFFWDLCRIHISSLPQMHSTRLHGAYRQYIIDEPRQFDTSTFPTPTIWSRTSSLEPQLFECLYSLDGINLIANTIVTTRVNHAPRCYCCMIDDDSDYDDNGTYASHSYSREITHHYENELTVTDIFNLLDTKPEIIFALLEIFGYNRSLQILNEYSLYKNVPFFNPLRQPALTDCITCMLPLPNKPTTYVCGKEFCNKYFMEYLESVSVDETRAIISNIICSGADSIIYNYLFPFCNTRPNKLSKQFIPGLRTHVADYWKFLSVRLLQN
jgi:hypothetical protein